MTLSVRRLAESFAGEVSGIDLARLDDAATAAVKEVWLAHKDECPRLMRHVGFNFPADLRVPF